MKFVFFRAPGEMNPEFSYFVPMLEIPKTISFDDDILKVRSIRNHSTT